MPQSKNTRKGLFESSVKWVALGVALISIGLSIYYSVLWGLYIGQPWAVAVFSSLAYIVFVNMVFEAGVGLIIRTKTAIIKIHRLDKEDKPLGWLFFSGRILGALVCFIAWGAIVLYSMASTVGGQYEQIVQAERNREEEVYVVDNSKVIDNLESEVLSYEEEKAEIMAEIPTLLSRIKALDTPELAWEYKGTLDRAQQRKDEIMGRRRFLDEEIRRVNREKRELESVENDFAVDSGSAFSYFARITGGKELEIQFFLSLFPSLFIDIISPLALAVALYKKE
jgi:hypothetical protein